MRASGGCGSVILVGCQAWLHATQFRVVKLGKCLQLVPLLYGALCARPWRRRRPAGLRARHRRGLLECSSRPCGRACCLQLMRLGWEASEVSSQCPWGPSPASRVPRRLRRRPDRSSTRRADSGPASAPPPTRVQRPQSLALCAVAPCAPVPNTSARLRGHGVTTWRHPGYFRKRRRSPDGRTFGAYRL
ncbi:hypothetical protein NDU88_007491 [Pleurodeles waltl]|uniref:Uncharacterized protein n=1 Tax=Pleurodeles waltl TaxID=8319 RepID=A0AAV7NWF1_PLEWA|nr:hypothetical protein NDU88_007491 [Pleurodeles waltl]